MSSATTAVANPPTPTPTPPAQRSLRACTNLGQVLIEADLVDFICLVRPKGAIEFLSGAEARHWLALNAHFACQWRAEYGLCSTGPEPSLTAFIIHPKTKS